jgi:hypothetical protein
MLLSNRLKRSARSPDYWQALGSAIQLPFGELAYAALSHLGRTKPTYGDVRAFRSLPGAKQT